MKIALVAPYFHPVSGGREQTVLHLAKGLAKKGHVVTVLTTDLTPDGRKVRIREESWGFTVHRIKSVYLAFRFEIPLRIFSLKEFDIIHIISTDDTFTFCFLILAKIFKKPVIATIFTPFALLNHPRKILRPFLLIFEFLSIISMRIANVVQVKNEIDLEIAKRFAKNAELIPDGLPEHFIRRKSTFDFREKYGLKDKKIILFVNRIHPLKGPQILIKAMRGILDTFPEAFAVLIGPDSNGYTEEVKRLARKLNVSDSVLFLGFVSEDVKIAAYDAADVVVIPSIGEFTEAFSIVLSEAWARGKTVVVTPSRALRSRVKPGTGYVALYDPESFGKAVIKALKRHTKPPKVHTWEEVVEMMEKIYFKCTKNVK